ncbi:AIG2 family protein [Auriculariales sp. MPI-PUGE-AT-0066]|nr:AIG2 family protein [Auriculariales sp. MPI-PUGE-AT-0066]
MAGVFPLQSDEAYYFAYGSNLSTEQMLARCPNSVPVALAYLPGYEWIINKRRYANIVLRPDQSGGCYGVLYKIGTAGGTESDKKRLDGEKDTGISTSAGDEEPSTVEAWVYIDKKRVLPGVPWDEYVHRMNKGIDEAVRVWGLPESFVQVMREYVPQEVEKTVES